MKLACLFAAILVLGVWPATADTIDAVITTNSHYASGIHAVSNDVLVLPGASLFFDAGATVQFAQLNGSLVVEGALCARSAILMGSTSNSWWGWLWARPGSTVQLDACTLYWPGGSPFESVGPGSNAAVRADDAVISLSNTVFVAPSRRCFHAYGGCTVDLFSNTFPYSTYSPISYGGCAIIEFAQDRRMQFSGGGNMFLTGAVRNTGIDGITLCGTVGMPTSIGMHHDGGFSVKFTDDSLLPVDLVVSNAPLVIDPGTTFRINNSYGIRIAAGGVLDVRGTFSRPVQFLNDQERYRTNDADWVSLWRNIHFAPGSTGILCGVNIRGAGDLFSSAISSNSILVDNAFLVMSNAFIHPGSYWAVEARNNAFLSFDNVSMRYFLHGLQASTGSRAVMRNCTIMNMNPGFPPTGFGVYTDGSCNIDARFCWWGSATGPIPYGSGQQVYTNGNDVNVYPWLLAPPFSITNPPIVEITSHSDYHTTAEPQIMISGIATGSTGIVRIKIENRRSLLPIWSEMTTPTNWRAHVPLYPGTNPIAVFGWDVKSNAAVDDVQIVCTGGGMGTGGSNAPVISPIPARVVERNTLVQFRVTATSYEPEPLIYWTSPLPNGAVFDVQSREFLWIPQTTGVFRNIAFFVSDGARIVSNVTMITVVTNTPPVVILTEELPPACADETYYVVLATANAVGAVSWSWPASFIFPSGIGMTRAGVIAGVYDGITIQGANLVVTATDSRGPAFKATKTFYLPAWPPNYSSRLRPLHPSIPFCASGDTFSATLVARNGAGQCTWEDSSDVLGGIGLTLVDGVVSGIAHTDRIVPWTATVRDASNISAYANYTVPVLPRSQFATPVVGASKLNIVVQYKPGKTRTGSIKAKTAIPLPPGFLMSTNNPPITTMCIGTKLLDGNTFYKGKPGKSALYLRQAGTIVDKIALKQTKTTLQATFLLKNVDLGETFTAYGMSNFNARFTTTLPVWFRIGDYYTPVSNVAVKVTSKYGKASVGSAKW